MNKYKYVTIKNYISDFISIPISSREIQVSWGTSLWELTESR